MKICPFISHMIGEDRADILQIDGPARKPKTAKSSTKKKGGAEKDVVILGYDGDSPVGVATKSAKTKKSNATGLAHLFCLKDTCRFFQKSNGECKFDSIFDTTHEHTSKIEEVERQTKKIADVEKTIGKLDAVDQIVNKINAVEQQIKKAQSVKPDKEAEKATTKVTKELDKFWTFQTKSVAELIASIGDSEKKHEKSISELKNGLRKSLQDWKPELDLKAVDDMKGEIEKLQTAVASREDGIESFSTTVSELVMNIDDAMKQLQEKNGTLSERIADLESSLPDLEAIQSKIEKALDEKLDKVGSPNLSKEVKALGAKYDSRFQEILAAQKHIEDNFNKLSKSIEARDTEASREQTSWKHNLKKIEDRQAEVIELVQREKTRLEDESSLFKKKEAKKLNNLGVTSFHNGEFELARDQFMEAVDLDPRFAESWNNLGLVLTELQDEESATDAFSKAIELNPELSAAYNNLGYIFYKQGSFDQAIEMYNQALGRSCDNSSAYTNLGNAYFKRGNHEDARTAWEKALQIDPDNEKASRNLKRLENE
jgi:tetratricopeptide (TPR) repeat protein